MKFNERNQELARAETELTFALEPIIKKYNLNASEIALVLVRKTQSWAEYAVEDAKATGESPQG
jgi:hypothetical protein